MFGTEFEVILIIILAVITAMLFLGRGDFLMKTKQEQKKKSPEEQKKFGRGISLFTGIWLLAEIMLLFFGSVGWVTIVYIVVIVLSMAGLIFYCKKNA